MEENFEEELDGTIMSVKVTNFFCHDHLEVTLNKNVNFIVGLNGSGKSAILTALVVGLGGRATATNRGTNLQSFIKKGKSFASIEIKIKNNTTRAFRHDVYGDHILIVRTIHASSCNYKVKSSSGVVISTRHEEVQAIKLAHDIQVDNPISVLNQDEARIFLSEDPKKKYDMFRKATSLDRTEANYQSAIVSCGTATATWKNKKEASLELQKEFDRLKAKHEQMKSMTEMEAMKKNLQNEFFWSEIAELEHDANIVQETYDKLKAKTDKLAEKLRNMEQSSGSNNGTINALKETLDGKTLQKTALEQQLRDLESEGNNVQTELRSIQSASRNDTDSFNREKRKVQVLEREIHNIGSGGAEARRAELQARAARAVADAGAAHARFATAQHEAEQARAALVRARALHDQAHARAAAQAGRLRQMKQELRELESRGSDSLAVYGNNMPELCRRVQEAVAKGHFSAPPKGPIGAYLKVRDKNWGGALEHIIGGNIRTFCVNTPEDSRKLFQIMGQVFGGAAKPSVTCSRFLPAAHDVSRSSVRAAPHSSALDALEVRDPVVANFLIDNIGMESILLVPDHDTAMHLSDNANNVPKFCSKIVTLDSTEFHPAPNYRSYGGSGLQSRFLHLSTADRKRQLSTEIQAVASTSDSLKAEAEELNQQVREAQENERSASNALQALLVDRHNKDEAARAATEALDVQQTPQHAVLVDELNVSKENLSRLQRIVKELSAKEAEFQQKINEYDTKMRVVKNQLIALTAECRDLTGQIDREKMQSERTATEQMTYQQRLRENGAEMSQTQRDLNAKLEALEKKTKDAFKLGPRVLNPRRKDIVHAELEKTNLRLSSFRSDGLSREQVAEQLVDVEDKLNHTRRVLGEIKGHIKEGELTVDDNKRQLNIICSGRDGSSARHASGTASLSGGERSYSTVAFIMSLWQCVRLPFCFLDEFDVFMDPVKRKVVMELLIDHALKNSQRQFVFLTPQGASHVITGPKISIFSMADPRP